MEENRIRARRENFAIVDGRIVDVVAVKSVEKYEISHVVAMLACDHSATRLGDGKAW